MIFFKIFHDFSPQATPKFAAGETHPFAAGETLYRFSRYQSMVSEMPRAKSYCGS